MKVTKKQLRDIIKEEVSAAFRAADDAAETRYQGGDSQNFYGLFENLFSYAQQYDRDGRGEMAKDLDEAIKSVFSNNEELDNKELLVELHEAIWNVGQDHSEKVYKRKA